MRKALFSLVFAGLVGGVSAAEKEIWPVWVSCGDAEDVEVVGFRFTGWGYCEQVTGMDIGFIGQSRYFNGIQVNLLWSEVQDKLAGWQIGCLYNSAGLGDSIGIQTALWNESMSIFGFQIGLVNLSSYTKGFQIGLINRSDDMRGYQIGLINVIRNSPIPFFPGVNVGF